MTDVYQDIYELRRQLIVNCTYRASGVCKMCEHADIDFDREMKRIEEVGPLTGYQKTCQEDQIRVLWEAHHGTYFYDD